MFGPYGERDGRLERLRALLSGAEIPQSAIKARREELELSQRGLARVSGVSQPMISRIESGEQFLTNAAAQKLGAVLKMGRHELGLAEHLSLMRRLAVKSELDDPKAAVDIALHLLQTQPESEAGRRVSDAAVEALVDIAEAASDNWSGVGTKSKKRAARDSQGRIVNQGRG